MAGDTNLIIERSADEDIKMRNLEILIDGQFATNLSFGKRFETHVSDGAHEVKVTNSLFSDTLQIQVRPGETVNLQTGNRMPKIGGFLFALGMGPYRCFVRPL